jgi:hypothetical protein
MTLSEWALAILILLAFVLPGYWNAKRRREFILARQARTNYLSHFIRTESLDALHARYSTERLATGANEAVVFSAEVSVTDVPWSIENVRSMDGLSVETFGFGTPGLLVVTTKRFFFASHGPRVAFGPKARNWTKKLSQITSWRLEAGLAKVEFSSGAPSYFFMVGGDTAPDGGVILAAIERARESASPGRRGEVI